MTCTSPAAAFTVSAEPDGVLAAVIEHGMARVPPHLAPAENARLVLAVERLLANPPHGTTHLDYAGGAGVRAGRELLRGEFPLLDELFERPWMRAVAAGFLGDGPHLFNHPRRLAVRGRSYEPAYA